MLMSYKARTACTMFLRDGSPAIIQRLSVGFPRFVCMCASNLCVISGHLSSSVTTPGVCLLEVLQHPAKRQCKGEKSRGEEMHDGSDANCSKFRGQRSLLGK